MSTNRPVSVLVADVVHGEKNKPGRCAVAHAIKRLYPELRFVNVGERTIRYSNAAHGLRYEISTPRPVAKFLKEFDKGAHAYTDPAEWTLPSFEIRENEAETKPMTKQSAEAAWASRKDYTDPSLPRRKYRSLRRGN